MKRKRETAAPRAARRLRLIIAAVIVLVEGYAAVLMMLLNNPDALPTQFVSSVANWILLCTAMILPLFLVILAGIILTRTPHVTRKVKQVTKRGRTIWYRVDLPDDGRGGASREK